MARPKSKCELIDAADNQFAKLLNLIHSMEAGTRNAALFYGPGFVGKEAHWARDKNLRDILVHLYEWHQLLLDWVDANRTGPSQPFLPAPYNWKTYGELNVVFWRKHQDTPYDKSMEMVCKSHDQVMELIKSFSDKELFEKGCFTWTGTTTLGSYCISATSSHYDWAMKKLRAHIKALKAEGERTALQDRAGQRGKN
ncbi:ClbS/DfsB family four-helix bundle protein [uncultured Cohaesibacter sp.]|uniref:ClbS/DfsB family four-helix bundle protein n=1 Tax=uncultured Cohaesibacter sp. TaxID=1002546 RepID=UPI00292FED1F|nr:ClbS/DfsB family four-helix bundle protein [uncultured Cohaesibacter sp.]